MHHLTTLGSILREVGRRNESSDDIFKGKVLAYCNVDQLSGELLLARRFTPAPTLALDVVLMRKCRL